MESKRVGLYARYSPKPEDQRGENYTIASQLDAGREFTRKHYNCPQPLEFIDKNASAATLDRDGLDNLRDAVAKGLLDVVVVYSLDRLVRADLDWHLLKAEFRKHNVDLVFVQGGKVRCEDSPEEELAVDVQALFAAFERKKFRERTRRGRKRKAKEGWLPANAPYGYRYIGKKDGSRGVWKIVEEHAAIVRRIFQMMADGATTPQVAQILNAEGVPAAGGGVWYAPGIRNLMCKTAYYGQHLGTSGIAIDVDPIISRTLWEQAWATTRANFKGKSGQPPKEYALSGVLYCKRCGRRMGTHKGGRHPVPYYMCRNLSQHQGYVRHCHAPAMQVGKLDSCIWETVWETVESADLLYCGIRSYYDRVAAKSDPRKRNAIEAAIAKAQRQVTHAQRVYQDGESPLSYEARKQGLLDAQRALALAESQRPKETITMPSRNSVAGLAALLAQARRKVKNPKDRRELLQRLVERIDYADGKADIVCRIPVGIPQNLKESEEKYLNGSVTTHVNTFQASFTLVGRVA